MVGSQVSQVEEEEQVLQVDWQLAQEEVLRYLPEGQVQRPETMVMVASVQVRQRVELLQVEQPDGQGRQEPLL